ncbi:spermidine synthase [Paraburkholderia madseniana]|uniref:spermidine synthase n=1 Tax=Paraburkholderia madseniana TaxID=2599607 RepID=UPI0015C56391|nr:spermidine synthase [Paraburkholderia madseniana]NPT69862.1 spermidine synthase [Paraburkholderia madseniana]
MLKHDNLEHVGAGHEGRFPPLTFSKRDGLLYMHNGDEWDSTFGCMVLDHPTFLWMEYAQKMMSWMLFAERFYEKPRLIAQLGLGAGALARFCYARFPLARVEVVDINPAVIDACREMFCMPPEGERLGLIEADAMDYVSAQEHRASIDILQVDLYLSERDGPVGQGSAFYRACFDSLATDGMMTINIFGPDLAAVTRQNLQWLSELFDAVLRLPCEDNNILICFKRAPVIDMQQLKVKAAALESFTGIPASSWVFFRRDGEALDREKALELEAVV